VAIACPGGLRVFAIASALIVESEVLQLTTANDTETAENAARQG
jgi:hypothetical protein